MPAYHVERSVRINGKEPQVRSAVENFAEWPKWSPWLCMEPTARVNVFGTPGRTGHGYAWEGDLVGAGEMKLAGIDGRALNIDLQFLRPFKSSAKVRLEIVPDGDHTDVTWHMDSKLPFFLFFMVETMKSMIGMDFERGLKMLKEYVETGTVNSKTEVVGIVDVPAMNYLGIEARCTMREIGASMRQTMPAAHQCATEHHVELCGVPGALYQEVDLKRQFCHYIAFVQTKSLVQFPAAQSGTIGPCKALKVIHTGHYQHLGNAWSTAMAYQRYKKLKPVRSQHGFELYPNDPGETAEQDWRTEIFVPVRG